MVKEWPLWTYLFLLCSSVIGSEKNGNTRVLFQQLWPGNGLKKALDDFSKDFSKHHSFFGHSFFILDDSLEKPFFGGLSGGAPRDSAPFIEVRGDEWSIRENFPSIQFMGGKVLDSSLLTFFGSSLSLKNNASNIQVRNLGVKYERKLFQLYGDHWMSFGLYHRRVHYKRNGQFAVNMPFRKWSEDYEAFVNYNQMITSFDYLFHKKLFSSLGLYGGFGLDSLYGGTSLGLTLEENGWGEKRETFRVKGEGPFFLSRVFYGMTINVSKLSLFIQGQKNGYFYGGLLVRT